MVFRVELAPRAYSDLDSIAEYIVRRGSYESARTWFNGIMEAIASLREMPYRCPVVEESRALDREVRMLLHGRRNRAYNAYYLVNEIKGVVSVVHVRHWARQDLALAELGSLVQSDPSSH